MGDPIEELKRCVVQPGSTFHDKLEERLTVVSLKNLPTGHKMLVEEEKMHLLGKWRIVRRLYCVSNDPMAFEGVGWIIDEDIDFCMVCSKQFGFFLYRHHCRCCGNLVCDPCSPDRVVIQELKELGEQRVCLQCYYGQEVVYASRDGPERPELDHPQPQMQTTDNFDVVKGNTDPDARAKETSICDDIQQSKPFSSKSLLPTATVDPTPGVVLKTKTTHGKEKVFINLLHHPSVPHIDSGASDNEAPFTYIGATHTNTDKHGEDCIVVDTAINSEKFHAIDIDRVRKKAFQDEVHRVDLT